MTWRAARMPHARTTATLAALGVLVLAGCSDDGNPGSGTAIRSGDPEACPGAVVDVVVSVGQWADPVERLGGACATVTTVVASSAVDPHSFEPDTADIAAFSAADLVVVNGAGYDGWAEAAVENLDPAPALVSVAEVARLTPHEDEHATDDHTTDDHTTDDHAGDDHAGDDHATDDHATDDHAGNGHAGDGHADGEGHAGDGHADGEGHEGTDPHFWYQPDLLPRVAAAVTGELADLSPDAAGYLEEQAAAWAEQLRPYLDAVESLRAEAEGRTYAATESVFDRTAAAVGLTDRSPEGYRRAAGNESEPAPGDLAEFEAVLADGTVDVLIYNVQTRGSIPERLRAVAEDAGVPVVEVTESPSDEDGSFVAWQLAQLSALSDALAATP